MSDLKTLKDIKKYYPMCLRRKGDILLMGKASEEKMLEYEKKELIDINVLRPEIINWIMEINEVSKKSYPQLVEWINVYLPGSFPKRFNEKELRAQLMAIAWGYQIMFNIMESDLK